MEYMPDSWVIVRITTNDGEKIDKVLAGWYGGFAGSDYFRLNSGITKIERKTLFANNTNSQSSYDVYEIHGYNGSIYRCLESDERLTCLTGSIFHSLKDNLKDDATVEIIDIKDIKDILEEYS
jgi:hypothetical protein